jgi:hypothetical protein
MSAKDAIARRYARWLARRYPGTRWSDGDADRVSESPTDDTGRSLAATEQPDSAIGERSSSLGTLDSD